MIRIKVSELLGKHKMTRKDLADAIGVRPNTIGDLYNENVKKIDVEVLDKICKTFNCEIEEILEYIVDKE